MEQRDIRNRATPSHARTATSAPGAPLAVAGKHAAHVSAHRVVPTNWSLVLLFAIIVGSLVLTSSTGDFDNDMWWLLATGREIVENGIPYTNPWSIHEGLNIVVQQWLAAVILYGVYCAFGFMGLKFLVVLQGGVLAVVLFGMCRVVSGHRHGSGEVFGFAIAIAFISLLAYLSVRPHFYSMTMYALVITVLELYRLQHRRRWLILVPILVLVHANLHLSMAPFDLFIIALYLIPDIPALIRSQGVRCPVAFFRMDHAKLPLLIVLLVSALALLANPYGINGALYLVSSYGAAGYGDYINEMGRTGFWTDYGGAAMAMIVLGAIAVGHNGHRRIDVPLTVLFIVCIPLAMMHTRNEWLVSFFALPLFARSFGTVRLNTADLKIFGSKIINGTVALLLAIGFLAYVAIDKWPAIVEDAERDTSSLPSTAADYLDEYTQSHGIEKSSLRLYNSFNSGGYLEWRGYRVFMDPRPELWEPGITGVDRHYYQEFVDLSQGTLSAREVVAEYDFDFLIVYTSSDLATYLKKNDNYQVATSGSGYQVWAKKALVNDEEISSSEAEESSSASGLEESTTLSLDPLTGETIE